MMALWVDDSKQVPVYLDEDAVYSEERGVRKMNTGKGLGHSRGGTRTRDPGIMSAVCGVA